MGLATAGLLTGFVTAEVVVRALSSAEGRWEIRSFLAADAGMEQREGRYWQMMRPDALLGHAPKSGYRGGQPVVSFDQNGLRVHPKPSTATLALPVPIQTLPLRSAPVRSAPVRSAHVRLPNQPSSMPAPPILPSALGPLLVVGDGFAMGEGVGDGQTVPAHLAAFLKRDVLNGGVSGYGIDQAVLRGEWLAGTHAPSLVVLAFTVESVRRAGLRRVAGGEKPYFLRMGGGLQLRNVPVPSDEEQALPPSPVRHLLAHSLLVAVIVRRAGLVDWWLERHAEEVAPLRQPTVDIACGLMDRLRRLVDEHRLEVLIVAQYTAAAWRDQATLRSQAAVADRVLACARNARLDVLDTRGPFAAAVAQDNVAAYYAGASMTDAGNRLTARLIARHVASGEVQSPAAAAPPMVDASGG